MQVLAVCAWVNQVHVSWVKQKRKPCPGFFIIAMTAKYKKIFKIKKSHFGTVFTSNL